MTIRDICFPSSEGGCASKALQRSACPETLFSTLSSNLLSSSVYLQRPHKVEEPMNTNVSDMIYDRDGSGFSPPPTFEQRLGVTMQKKKKFALNRFHVFFLKVVI